MEYILLQPLKTVDQDRSNVSLIERKTNLTQEEEELIIHEAGGPYSGFIIKKILPFDVELEKCHLSFKLKVFMKQSGNQTNMQHEQRTIQFWFNTESQKDRMTCSNSFFHNLFKGDNFPKDYFMFLLKIMQIFKALKPISLLKIDIQKIGAPQPMTTPSKLFFLHNNNTSKEYG